MRILVTDADRFLGPATARRLDAAGHDVVAHTQRLTAADQVDELVAGQGFQRAVEREVPRRRLTPGDEAAAVVEYLLSPGAAGLFGAVLPVDGGWSLG